MEIVLLAIILQVSGGIVALSLSRYPVAATVCGAGTAVFGCLMALPTAWQGLCGGVPQELRFVWDATHGAFSVALDPLSAFFLVPVLGLSALAAVYGGNYLLAYRHEKRLGSPWFFFNIFVAGMVLVLISRTALLFLVAWEIMSISAYCLVTFEHEKPESRQAGWIYLIATHLGVICLFIAFLLLGRHAGGLEFQAFRDAKALSAAGSGVIFGLALIGFGAKAGLVPFHVWLPEAHPAAPSHVSALMSGVMIKMGLYGILRMLTFLGAPAPWWGMLLAALGLVTGLVGISLALQQRDIKRALAYSSIENMGLIALAIGVAIWGRASQLPGVAVLAMAGALLHVWNHALMKGLMFLCAGSVLHGTGAKEMEKLGGLMKSMPWTGGAMMLGAVAISALPPLNGFVGKWLMYLSLMQWGLDPGAHANLIALLGVGVLALIGSLSAIAFVRLTGIVLLGAPRGEPARHAHESSPWMLGPMLAIIVVCLGVAVAPQSIVNSTTDVLKETLGADAGATLANLEVSAAPLELVGRLNGCVLAATVCGGLLLLAWTSKDVRQPASTWGCGYAAPTVRMQYTGRSFSEMLTAHLLPRFLRPGTKQVAPRGLFPASVEFASEYRDPVNTRVYEPFFRRWADRFSRLRILQQGKVHVYLVYIMLMVILLLAWASVRTWWWGHS